MGIQSIASEQHQHQLGDTKLSQQTRREEEEEEEVQSICVEMGHLARQQVGLSSTLVRVHQKAPCRTQTPNARLLEARCSLFNRKDHTQVQVMFEKSIEK